MANYHEMTAYELEQKYDSLANELMECTDDARIEAIAEELDPIQDILDERGSEEDDDE